MTPESRAPQYISSHSADVILSDIRPIKLKKDALNALNVLVDEILWNILNSSRSLQTERLKAGLLHVLPTSLGKEALLEAEVELRAYWDRTIPNGQIPIPEDDSKTFNLPWSYELLRLKCEAYSTLNESDEDPEAEKRLQNRMVTDGAVSSPRQSLVAPAALYLTAILESICEHILSDVARVAARDSSRTGATGQDLFVALCEDDAVYGLFKTLKVYEQIELLSQGPTPRRSKSISRTDKLSISRTSSQEQPSSGRDTPGMPPSHKSRMSTDTTAVSSTNSRSSLEKARAVKKLISRSSHDRGTEDASHRRSDSVVDEGWEENEDALQEFDSLMKSGETMKVSLTPDRLRSMEARKQKEDSSSQPSRTVLTRRSSPRQVHSITEDEEEPTASNKRSAGGPGSPTPSVPLASRTRSPSAAARPSFSKRPSDAEFSMPSTPPRGMPKGIDADPFPQKTRKVQRKRESLDLDDIMNGSEEETESSGTSTRNKSSTASPRRTAVSSRTRDLVDFLDQGPPSSQVQHLSKAGKELVDFLSQGPPHMGPPPSSPEAKKGSGRLQRMMSKLSMTNGDRSRVDELSKSPKTPTSSSHPPLRSMSSAGNLPSLANKPIPPRYPRPISPPSSPSEEQHVPSRPRAQSASKATPPRNEAETPAIPAKPTENGVVRLPGTSLNGVNNNTRANAEVSRGAISRVVPTQVASPPLSPDRSAIDPSKKLSRKANDTSAHHKVPEIAPSKPVLPAGSFSEDDAKDIRRMFTKATNVDECRVLLEMFLAKSGRPLEPHETENPYPSPSSSERGHKNGPIHSGNIEPLESSLVDMFLGGEKMADKPVSPVGPRKPRIKRKPSASAAEQKEVPTSVTSAPSPQAPASLPPSNSGLTSPSLDRGKRSPAIRHISNNEPQKVSVPVPEVGA